MLKILVVLALLVAFYLPAAAAFAGDEIGADHDTSMAQDVIQAEPIDLGTVAGSDKAPFGPYFEQRLDNMGQ